MAVQYPVVPDVAREVEIRGSARQLGLVPDVPLEYARFAGTRRLPNREIVPKRTGSRGPKGIVVARGQWFVVHPRPGEPVLEVLSDEAFHAVFDGPDVSEHSVRALAAAVAAEAHWQLGRQVELRYLDANDHATGMWAHPRHAGGGRRDPGTVARAWRRAVGAGPARHPGALGPQSRRAAVAVDVRPHTTQQGSYHPDLARHAIPAEIVRGTRRHAAGRAVCETTQRSQPLPLGPVTIAPPDCPRCLKHLDTIADRHGRTLEQAPALPSPPADDSDLVRDATPVVTAALPELGAGWHLVQYAGTDPRSVVAAPARPRPRLRAPLDQQDRQEKRLESVRIRLPRPLPAPRRDRRRP
ncbi:hypothetical protein P3102_10520 [Amycolatopsis sp. QT-25]|uniref:hypothetical protein n=1 Tax=Amycolatopsis sp. QT-25 TaxID=3034022 RepID=UPI0023EB7147|nr:hypothetical protein [Amycolatopsis sp. QT-25]WET83479.1 hypothetical protein P3102_10520 [Amycolatopsis sp. QT-25]